jgi:hypothetical protein
LPVGGYADMATHGEVEHILPSQHALDELEFLRRFAERELLFFRREEPPAQNRQEVAVVIDQGVRTWGDVRLVLAAAALALGKQAAARQQPFRLAATSNAGRLLDPLTAEDEVLGELIEASDLTFNPGAAVEAVLEQPADGLRDVVLLTHQRNLREADVLTAARRAGPRDRIFAVTLDEEGAAAISEVRHGAAVTMRRFRVEFNPAKPPPPPAEPLTRWTGAVEPVPFPFRFGTTGDIAHFEFDYDAHWLLTAGADGMLHLWGLDGQEREVLPRPFVDGHLRKQVSLVTGVRGGFALTGTLQSNSFVAHYDIARRHCHAWSLEASSPFFAFYAPAEHCIVLLVSPRPQAPTAYVVDLTTQELLTQAQASQRPRAASALDVLRAAPTRWSAHTWYHYRESPDEVVLGDYRITPASGTITYRTTRTDDHSFVPEADGKPLLAGATLLEAQAAGGILAVEARLRDRSHRLMLFRGQDGTVLYERRIDPKLDQIRRFLLSRDGRWLARERVGRIAATRIDAPAAEVTTLAMRDRSAIAMYLSERSVLLALDRHMHCHLISWNDEMVEFTYERGPGGGTPLEHDAFRKAFAGSALVVANRASAAPLPIYDPERFVAVAARAGICFALDHFGQVAVFDSDRELLCMFMVHKDRIAAWMPDGTRVGSSTLGLGPETPAGKGRLAQVLSRRRKTP